MARIVAAARAATSKRLFTKLSPTLPDLAEVARAAEAAGTDGLSLVNTLRGLVLDERTLLPVLSTGSGGISGPAVRPVMLAAVYACYRATGLPIVALGGIETGRHAVDAIAAGASAVALGTVLFRDPAAPARVRLELESEVAERAFQRPLDMRGVAHGAAGALLSDSMKIPANSSKT